MKKHQSPLLGPLTALALLATACTPSGRTEPGAEAPPTTATAAAAGTSPPSAPAPSARPPTARELVAGGAPLIDVRTRQEFAAGHVPGAVNIPYDEVGRRLSEIAALTPDSGNALVLYCRSGRRSAIAADLLRRQGYAVTDIGPMSAW